MSGPQCPLCGVGLQYRTISTGNAGGIAAGLICLAIGIILCTTGIGALLGVPLCLCALFMGGKRSHVLRCPECRYQTTAA